MRSLLLEALLVSGPKLTKAERRELGHQVKAIMASEDGAGVLADGLAGNPPAMMDAI